jgi:hypothetical protein
MEKGEASVKTGKLQFWAMETKDLGFAMMVAGCRRDTSTVVRCRKGVGFVLDVYPEEVRGYERDFGRKNSAVVVLGKFDTVGAAYECLEHWARLGQ